MSWLYEGTGALKIKSDVLRDYYLTQTYMEKGFKLITKAVEQPPVSHLPPPGVLAYSTLAPCSRRVGVRVCVSSCLTQWDEIQGLFAFGEPLEAGVWVVLFAEMMVAAACLMLVEGYGDNEALPINPWGLIMDCWFHYFLAYICHGGNVCLCALSAAY